MRVDYQKYDKTQSYYHYNQFSVGSVSEEYPLTVGGFTGVGTDWFVHHNGLKFSTTDNDNDIHRSSSTNCAVSYKSGWWYNHCYHININTQPPNAAYISRQMLFSEMKIRPKDYIIK